MCFMAVLIICGIRRPFSPNTFLVLLEFGVNAVPVEMAAQTGCRDVVSVAKSRTIGITLGEES